MGKIPDELRQTIARNIRNCRNKKYPGRGGGKKCAEAFGVSPQQWSPWERGMRTPDEYRLSQIAKFFDVTVEYLRRDNNPAPREQDGGSRLSLGTFYYPSYGSVGSHESPMALMESDAPPYGLPSIRREDNITSAASIADLAQISAKLLGMVSTTIKGVTEGKYDLNKSIIVLRRLCEVLEHKLREAETPGGPSF